MPKDLSQSLKTDIELIDKKLTEIFSKRDVPYSVLKESMLYSLFTGGKRVRPFLTLEFCRALCGDIDTAVSYGTALECVHTYSLIHDDMPCMDNDDFRRGKPTNHKEYGEATALLAGDSLLTDAFGIIADTEIKNGFEDTRIKAVSELSRLAGSDGMAAGQMLDLIGETEKLSEKNFTLMNKLKTGCLIRCACILGVLASNPTEENIKIADTYGKAVGLAFQIEDDILDEGEEGKTTFLTFISKDEARERINDLTLAAKEAVEKIDKDGILSAFADRLAVRTV